jgi:hypothetical protein
MNAADERCNRPAWYQANNGMRLCLDHRPTLDDPFDPHFYPESLGPCDWPTDERRILNFRTEEDMPAIDYQAIVSAMVGTAVSRYYNDPMAGVVPHYLHYRPSTVDAHGELRFFAEGSTIPDGWELAHPEADRGAHTRNQLVNDTRERAQRLPILKPS